MKAIFSPGKWRDIILLGLMGAIVGFTLFGENGLTRLRELRRQRDELLLEIRTLKEYNSELAREVKLLQHDDRYLERIAREELGLTGPNEIVFRFSRMLPPAAEKSKAKVGLKLPRSH